MDKKTECEIVQDLLLNYVDEILNKESKEFVEKHLKECPKCQKRLKEIKDDLENDVNRQEKEINYLKKISRKNRIKSVIGALIICIVIIVLGIAEFFGYKYLVMKSLYSKMSDIYEIGNFYIEKVRYSSDKDTNGEVCKIWYKDGKCKVIQYGIDTEGNTVNFEITKYADINKSLTDIYCINEENKTVRKSKSYDKMDKNYFIGILNYFAKVDEEGKNHCLEKAFYTKISSDSKYIAKSGIFRSDKYYVFEDNINDNRKFYIDMDTGLPIMMTFSQMKNSKAYENLSVETVEEIQNTFRYYYEFNTVKDEDVQMPNLSDFEEIIADEGMQNTDRLVSVIF